MDQNSGDIWMQVLGLAMVFVPMAALAVGLTLHSRRRRAAERTADAAAAALEPPSRSSPA